MRKEELRHDPVRENIVKSIEYVNDNQNTVLKIFANYCFKLIKEEVQTSHAYQGDVYGGDGAEVNGFGDGDGAWEMNGRVCWECSVSHAVESCMESWYLRMKQSQGGPYSGMTRRIVAGVCCTVHQGKIDYHSPTTRYINLTDFFLALLRRIDY